MPPPAQSRARQEAGLQPMVLREKRGDQGFARVARGAEREKGVGRPGSGDEHLELSSHSRYQMLKKESPLGNKNRRGIGMGISFH